MIDDYLIGTPPRRYWHILPGFTMTLPCLPNTRLFFARAQVSANRRYGSVARSGRELTWTKYAAPHQCSS